MSTKEQINQVLQVFGLRGLDPTSLKASSSAVALTLLARKSKLRFSDPQRIIYELKRQSLVEITIRPNEVSFRLTPAGIYRLQRSRLDELSLRLPKKWDKKWRAVAFDIPTSKSKERAAFVKRLQDLKFSMLQKSLWVYPGECFDVVLQLADYYNLSRYCSMFELTRMDEPTTQRLLKNYKNMKI